MAGKHKFRTRYDYNTHQHHLARGEGLKPSWPLGLLSNAEHLQPVVSVTEGLMMENKSFAYDSTCAKRSSDEGHGKNKVKIIAWIGV